MPSLRQHQSATTTKMLLIGDSGSGKSGSLASLAAAGYNLRIIDVDNGIDTLHSVLTDPKSPYPPEAADRVTFITLTDPMRNVGGKLSPSRATVWTRTVQLLQHWKTEDEDLGPITTWGTDDVLVIDSLTFLGSAAMNFALQMQGRLGQKPQLQDWGDAQNFIEQLVQMLYDESVKCNVIITAHVKFIGEDNGPQRGYPDTPGRALSPKIGRYFNTILACRTEGFGKNAKRMIFTKSAPMVELKNSAPLRVKESYPIETGLADCFKAMRGEPSP